MKGVMYPVLAIFVIVASLFAIVFIIPRAVGPSLATYGIKQASVVAKSVATSINALGAMDEGLIERVHPGEGSWDILIRGDNVTVSHGEFSASEKLLVSVDPVNMVDTRQVTIEKRGDRIKVS